MSSGCLNTYKNSIIAEGSRVRLLPPITPTRNSMIAEGFRVWLLPARTPTRNPLDFEGFRVEEMSGKWTADFQHSRLALPHTIDPRTGSVPGQNKRENGRTNKPNPNTKRLPLFNVGGLRVALEALKIRSLIVFGCASVHSSFSRLFCPGTASIHSNIENPKAHCFRFS